MTSTSKGMVFWPKQLGKVSPNDYVPVEWLLKQLPKKDN
jgi:hypothetical protein